MKKNIFILLIFSSLASVAQPVRLHLMGGFANYSGDIQQKKITLNQAQTAISAGATFNITDRLAIRSDYSFAKLRADDKYNSKPQLRARNLNFQTYIQELTLLAEYDILSLNVHKLSPYVFGGVGVFHFSPYTYDVNGKKVHLAGLSTEGEGIIPGRKPYKTTQLNIPLGAGIKYALSNDIHIAFEIGLRTLKTDYLDDVSATYVDRNTLLAAKGQKAVELAFRGNELKSDQPYPAGGSQRGNSGANDLYYFGLFRIDFRMNWFDRDGGGGGGRGLQCPVKL
jgi:opacity protein-like surface antigen